MGRRIASYVGRIERALWSRSPVILMYHRVAPAADDLWGIAVGPERFAEQIEALKRVRQVASLDEVLAWMDHGQPGSRPLAAVTFDDGYHDAFTTALPILERQDCPATVFVATGLVGTDKAFWWDELVRLILSAPPSAPPLTLTFGQKPMTWLVADDLSERRRLCRRLRRRLRDLEPFHIETHLDAISAWSGVPRGAPESDRAMTPDEVHRLGQGLVTIGAHTVRHPSLPTLAPQAQLDEIAASRTACEAWTGKPVDHFAYPFGHYDRTSVLAARAVGFRSTCATTPGVVRPWTDPHRLPRIVPGVMDGEALTKLLS